MKKVFLILVTLTLSLFATTVSVDKSVYRPFEPINVTLTDMPGNEGDWVGIFPKGSANAWENVKTWKFDGKVKDGTYALDGVEAGDYEARVFLNNSYTLLAKVGFSVKPVVYHTKVTTSKTLYDKGENITITLTGMPGNEGDWVGIFKKGDPDVWENCLSWKFDGKVKDGTYDLDGVDVGDYEVRVFLNNSFRRLATVPFKVQQIVLNTTISTQKSEYSDDEQIKVTASDMLGNPKDWIGIFKKDAPNKIENILKWKWTNAGKNPTVTFDALPEGEYDVRAFFSDTLNEEARYSFTVVKAHHGPTVYEDAENGLNPNWIRVLGNYDPRRTAPGFHSSYSLVLVPQWVHHNNQWTNLSEYHLPLHNSSQFILSMDMGGLKDYKLPTVSRKGYMPHYSIGVYVDTKKGRRVMVWDSYFNHQNIPAHREDYGNGYIELDYPSVVEHVRGWYKPVDLWTHFRVDVNAELKKLEPDNEVIYIDKLYATGGFLDNITLSKN